jgi:hypothetical protein
LSQISVVIDDPGWTSLGPEMLIMALSNGDSRITQVLHDLGMEIKFTRPKKREIVKLTEGGL